MIGDLIGPFRKTQPAVNKNFCEKIELRQVPVIVSHTEEVELSTMLF